MSEVAAESAAFEAPTIKPDAQQAFEDGDPAALGRARLVALEASRSGPLTDPTEAA
jgi:hypothetical protein